MKPNLVELRNKFSALVANGARLASITYRAKDSGELARHTLIMGADYQKVVEDSLLEFQLQLPELKGVEAIACLELIESAKNTLSNMEKGEENDAYTKKGMYFPICPGIKILEKDMTAEIQGLAHAKKVIEPGEYKKVNSSPKTIAKNNLRKASKWGKLRTFSIDLGHLERVKINGEELVIGE